MQNSSDIVHRPKPNKAAHDNIIFLISKNQLLSDLNCYSGVLLLFINAVFFMIIPIIEFSNFVE